ncbi:MAG: NAD-dependent epimerase/dehydratase family protein [Alphaproteobacteria bacterium]|nr:NAD-dependent epimerase/dehydratase family protein [Alphaproteobacteria bacterium]
MKILVTGSTGFVGAAVARHLLAEGHELRLLVRTASRRDNIADLDAEIVVGDLTEPTSLAGAVKGCDALYHVAADYRLWVRDPRELYETNVGGSKALILAASQAGVQRIVYTSSVAALGLTGDGTPADETTPVRREALVGHYKRSKYDAEQAVLDLVTGRDCPVVIVNPSTPIGPRDIKPTPTGRMIVQAARGKMPAYVDTGLNVVHVDDVARGHLQAFAKGRIGERYILGGENMTLARILADVAAQVGRKPPTVKLPHGLIMPIAMVATALARVTGREPFVFTDAIRMARKRMYFSSQKAEAELGYTHRPPDQAIADAVEWFLQAGYFG